MTARPDFMDDILGDQELTKELLKSLRARVEFLERTANQHIELTNRIIELVTDLRNEIRGFHGNT